MSKQARETEHHHKCYKTRSQHSEKCYVGTCPACRKPVLWDTPDGPVWTCPADLSDSNPYRETPDERITEDMREKAGVFSSCGEDFGFQCYDRMPLHSACYARGNY